MRKIQINYMRRGRFYAIGVIEKDHAELFVEWCKTRNHLGASITRNHLEEVVGITLGEPALPAASEDGLFSITVPIKTRPGGDVDTIVGRIHLSRAEHDRIVETAFATMQAPTLHFASKSEDKIMMEAWIDFGSHLANCFKKPEAGEPVMQKLPVEIASATACAEKPPLGIMPRKIHDEHRGNALSAAIGRYISAGKQVPVEWVEELMDICGIVDESKDKFGPVLSDEIAHSLWMKLREMFDCRFAVNLNALKAERELYDALTARFTARAQLLFAKITEVPEKP